MFLGLVGVSIFRYFVCYVAVALFAFSFSVNANIELEGVDGELADNLDIYKKQVSYPDAERITELAVSKYKAELEASLNKGLRAFGYFAPQFKYSTNDIQLWRSHDVILDIQVGPQTIIKSFDFKSDLNFDDKNALATVPAKLISQYEKLKKDLFNKPLISSTYDNHKSVLQSVALSFGYFDFKWLTNEVNVESKKAIANISWDLQFGKRYQFGELSFLEDNRGASLVESVKQFKSGDWFSQAELARFTQRVRQTGYFDSVIVRPNKSKKTEIAGQVQVPIELILISKPKDEFRFGIGVSTDTGPRLTTDWQRPWVNLRGHSVSSSLFFSRQEQVFDIGYTVPMANPLNDFFKFQFGIKNTTENQTDSTVYTVALQRQFGAENEHDWNKVVSIKYERENFTQGFSEEQSSELLIPGLSFNRIRKDDDIFVTNGDRQTASIEVASESLLSDIDLARLRLSTKWIRTFDKHRIIARADVGAMVSSDFESVPSSLRFFAGGDQSIRGFGLDEIGQTRVTNDGEIELIGGRYLNVASVEYAYSINDKWRAALFVDAGGAGEKFVDDIAKGVGVGAHWLSPVGTIRLYLARGINGDEKNWRIHFSIGPGL